ncbi:unnamed protein product [Durusdinium trenchii]|uniref:Uncharacterized protein n=1 Tax=Durusdinium trenchii TaxID=1381693 RepID=A0ABP0T234_9DINO
MRVFRWEKRSQPWRPPKRAHGAMQRPPGRLQQQLQDAVTQELPVRQLQQLLSRCASAREYPSRETSEGMASLLVWEDFKTLLGLAHAVMLLQRGATRRQAEVMVPLRDSLLHLAEARVQHLEPSEIRPLTSSLASLPGSRNFLVSAAARWRSPTEVLQPKEWSLVMNAFARGGLPTASAQALLQQNLEMLEDVMIEKTWSARDVSLLCNALHRLRPTTSEAERLHRFYARVLGSWAMDPPDCGPQDLAQLASSLAAVSQKYRSEVVHGFRVLLQPWTTGMAKELSWGVSLEGLCALLNALERLALLDLSLAISPAAVQRVSHAKLSASHLGHLCYIFSRWLEPKWASEAGDSLEPRGVHAQAPAPAACEMRALRVQVLELFKSTLCPAIVELASTFQRPKNVALTALALARLCRSTKDEKDEKVQRLSHEVAESLCQQSLLDRAEQSDSDSLQWCNWQSLDLAQLAESLSALLTSRMDVKLPAVATLLSSISKYLLEEVENMPIQQAIRIGAAVAPTLDGPEVCHRLAQVVAEIKFDLPIPAAALWLRTLQLLEMNEANPGLDGY